MSCIETAAVGFFVMCCLIATPIPCEMGYAAGTYSFGSGGSHE
jgi:hypothetical protein